MHFPTHIKEGCLDLVLTNMPEKVSSILDVGRIGKSDYVVIQLEIETVIKNTGEKKVVKNWKKAKWENIKQGLRAQVWPMTTDRVTAEEAWTQLRRVIDGLVDENVPESEFKQRRTDWMTGDILREVRKKRRLWKKAKGGGSKEEYEAAAKKVKNLIRAAKRSMEKKLAHDKNGNKKHFFSYIKRKTKSKPGIGPIADPTGTLLTEEKDMTRELNRYFSSVFTRDVQFYSLYLF